MVEPEILDAGRGDCRYGWFEGVLTGPRPENSRLVQARTTFDGLGLGAVDVSTDGGRFAVLPPGDTLAGTTMSVDRLDDFVRALRELIVDLPDTGDVESSLRCTEVLEDETRETMFVAEGRDIRALSRVRPIADTDRQREPAHVRAMETPQMGWGPLLTVLALLAVVFSLVAWQGGWVERVLSADVTTLAVDTGSFGSLLEAEIEPSWGEYEITLRRGATYADTAAQVEAAIARAGTAAERAAVNAVADGGTVYVRLENDDSIVLASRRVELRKLLTESDAKVRVRLPGRIRAATVRLALDSGLDE